MKAYERLLQYVRINTTSCEENTAVTPSGKGEWNLARALEEEMRALGLQNTLVDDHAYVYGFLPATKGLEGCPRIGLIAHMDTVDDCGGTDTHPQVVTSYTGGPIALGSSGRVLDPELFPHLKDCVGKTIITTDGTSVLGADDKAGIAEIMTLCEGLLREEIPHGPLSICFTPDEEIGHGAELLDLDRFGAEWAYTADGSAPGEIEYETFNAAAAKLRFTGFSVHPGSAKGKMINAMLLAMEANAMLPPEEVPARTEGREGFYHLTEAKGNVTEASLHYILRDHDAAKLEEKKRTLEQITRTLNEKYGPDTVHCEIRDQYRNMAEVLSAHPQAVEVARSAILAAGAVPFSHPVRGGTDGARLSFRGLPCPNLGTGGYAYHGFYEHAVAEEMDLCVEILLQIVRCVREMR